HGDPAAGHRGRVLHPGHDRCGRRHARRAQRRVRHRGAGRGLHGLPGRLRDHLRRRLRGVRDADPAHRGGVRTGRHGAGDPVGRIAWSLSHVLVIAIGIVLIAAVTGLGTGLAAAVVTEDAALVGDILLSHLAVVPAALAGLGLCTAVFGWLPRLMAPAGWVLVAVMGIVDMFAELLDLPDWFRALSPLHHLAGIPVEDFALTPFLVVTGVAVALVAVGLLGLRRRQVNVV